MRDLHVTIERNDPAKPTTHTRASQVRRSEHRARAEPTRLASQGRRAATYSGRLLPMESRALVLGGASCLWRDVAVLETLIDGFWPGLVIAVNDVGCTWPRRLDHWATVHHEKMNLRGGWENPNGGPHGWVALRERNGYPDGYMLWGHTNKGHYALPNHVQQWGSGSSGLLAVAVAYHLGVSKVVLAGTPMDSRPHFRESVVHHPEQAWTSVRSHWNAWKKNLKRLKERTRSLSGRTREVLGPPTLEWLVDSQDRRVA